MFSLRLTDFGDTRIGDVKEVKSVIVTYYRSVHPSPPHRPSYVTYNQIIVRLPLM